METTEIGKRMFLDDMSKTLDFKFISDNLTFENGISRTIFFNNKEHEWFLFNVFENKIDEFKFDEVVCTKPCNYDDNNGDFVICIFYLNNECVHSTTEWSEYGLFDSDKDSLKEKIIKHYNRQIDEIKKTEIELLNKIQIISLL